MDTTRDLVGREEQAYLIFTRLRDALDILPDDHPAAEPLAAAVVAAEQHWRELRAAVEGHGSRQPQDGAGPAQG